MLIRDEKGATAVEFAFLAPILFAMLVGIAQMGTLFYANAGVQSALADGARYATIFPRPDRQQIIDRIKEPRWGVNSANLKAEITSEPEDPYVDIEVTYSVPLDFIFFETPPITLDYSRRAHAAPAPPSPSTGTGTGGSGTGTGTGTGTGGTGTGDDGGTTTPPADETPAGETGTKCKKKGNSKKAAHC